MSHSALSLPKASAWNLTAPALSAFQDIFMPVLAPHPARSALAGKRQRNSMLLLLLPACDFLVSAGNVKLDTVFLAPRESFMRASLNSLQTRSWMTCWRGLARRWTPWSSA
ncbi:unnamed protein product [Ectocarpus sp. CCAP 1310/34]|nr:unnamed protein product [Ectocarpus sp. CCAP 1310/34]